MTYIFTCLAFLLASSAIYFVFMTYTLHQDNEALRSQLRDSKKEVWKLRFVADRWIRVVTTFSPLLQTEINPELMQELTEDLDEDRKFLTDDPPKEEGSDEQ